MAMIWIELDMPMIADRIRATPSPTAVLNDPNVLAYFDVATDGVGVDA